MFVAVKKGTHVLAHNCWYFWMVFQKIDYILHANYKVSDQLMIVSGHYLFILSQKNINCHNLDNTLSGIPHQFNSWQVLCQNDYSGCMWMLKRSLSCGILGMVSFFTICLLLMEPSIDESSLLRIKAIRFFGWSRLTSAQTYLGTRMIIIVVLSVSYENTMISRFKVNPLVGH